jgi:hypothetical protein
MLTAIGFKFCQASQQMAQYRSAYQLDKGAASTLGVAGAHDGAGGVQLRMDRGAGSELKHLEALTSSVMPKRAVHKRVGGQQKKKASAASMLSHWGALNKEVFPASKPSVSAHKEKQTSAQELAHLKKLSNVVWPTSEKERAVARGGGRASTAKAMLSHYGAINKEIFPAPAARRKSKAAATSEQELSHLKAISDEVFPKEVKRKAASAQTAQGMLSRYAKLNDLVFPKEGNFGKAQHVQVQDV